MNIEQEVIASVYDKIWSSTWERFYDHIMKECGFTSYNDVGKYVSGRVRISTQRMTDALHASVKEYEY
jgi:hypothetical protein